MIQAGNPCEKIKVAAAVLVEALDRVFLRHGKNKTNAARRVISVRNPPEQSKSLFWATAEKT